jgi:hypothetical protein
MNMFKRYTTVRSSKADISQLPADALIELTDDELEDATGGYEPHDHREEHRRHRRHRRRYYNRHHHRYEYEYYYD